MGARDVLASLLAALFAASAGHGQEPALEPAEAGVGELASNVPGVGARALGMAGAFTAIADDATAATWNPAGLAHLTRPEASLVYESWRGDIDAGGGEHSVALLDGPELLFFRSASLLDERGRITYGRPTFLSATYPLDLGGPPVALQLSARRLLALPAVAEDRRFRMQFLGAGVPAADAFSDSSRTSFSGGIELFSASAAVELREDLRLGLTLNRLAADYTFRSGYAATLSEGGTPLRQRSRNEVVKESFSDWFADLGLQWNLTKRWVLGAVYHTGFTTASAFRHTVTATETGAVFLGPSTAAGNGRITWPDSYAVGLAFTPTDRLRVAVDFTETAWSEGKREGFASAGFEPVAGDDGGRVIRRPVAREESELPYPNFDLQQDTRALRWGGEYVLFAADWVIPLRAGVFEEKAMLGAFPDFNRSARTIRGFTLGAGANYQGWVVDLAWVRAESDEDVLFAETRVADPEQGPTTKVAETLIADHLEIATDRFIVSLIRRF